MKPMPCTFCPFDVYPNTRGTPSRPVAIALQQAALSDEYFVKRKLYTNVDFYSGLIYRAMGFATEFFPVLFAIPRMAGYLSHWRESFDDPDTKMMQPAQNITFGQSNHLFHRPAVRPSIVASEDENLEHVFVNCSFSSAI
ncbi:hypothetical protein L2E82_27444 [Cichorium intybus]|uniref:Uncharacterized protein n=1 Tax=Cichorium intybus TaxID=13427 RepID=A0ACB9CT87_CICIN|nr:hypothetical protein L2E82_27444 [Cichorium intybus]